MAVDPNHFSQRLCPVMSRIEAPSRPRLEIPGGAPAPERSGVSCQGPRCMFWTELSTVDGKPAYAGCGQNLGPFYVTQLGMMSNASQRIADSLEPEDGAPSGPATKLKVAPPPDPQKPA